MKNLKQKLQSGFTLIETLVAISVFSLSVVIMMSVLADGITDTNYTQDKIVAGYLAQEGIEYMRNLRDTLMLYDVNSASAGWEAMKSKMIGASCHQTSGCYFDDDLVYSSLTESIKNLDMTACSGNCPILSYSASTGKYGYYGATIGFRRKINFQLINANEMKISSTVYWTQGSGTYNVTFSENLYNWIE